MAVPAISVRSIEGVGRTGRGAPGRGGGSGRERALGCGTALRPGVRDLVAALGLAADVGLAAALGLAAGRGLAAGLRLAGGLGLSTTAALEPAGRSVLAARLSLRRCGREVGSEPRTLDGGVSLIAAVSPGACNISNRRRFEVAAWQSSLQLCRSTAVSTKYMAGAPQRAIPWRSWFGGRCALGEQQAGHGAQAAPARWRFDGNGIRCQ